LLKTAARAPTAATIRPRSRAGASGSSARRHATAVEAAEAELRRHHHEPEQQRQRRNVDRAAGVGERRRPRRQQRDRPEQRDPGAVERKAREAPEQHAEVHRSEDGGDDAGHRAHGLAKLGDRCPAAG